MQIHHGATGKVLSLTSYKTEPPTDVPMHLYSVTTVEAYVFFESYEISVPVKRS